MENNITSKCRYDQTDTENELVKKHEVLELDKAYDEKNAVEIAVIKIWNSLLNFIVLFSPTEWKKIHDELNEGIVGERVSSKDCYRIGFIAYLKKFAKANNILFAKNGNKFFAYNGEYWIYIEDDLLKGFLHKAAKKMGIPDSLSGCVKFIKGTYDQLIESGFFEKMV